VVIVEAGALCCCEGFGCLPLMLLECSLIYSDDDLPTWLEDQSLGCAHRT
jgi:hypothetical protein